MAERCGVRPAELPGRKCYEVFHHMQSPPGFCPFALFKCHSPILCLFTLGHITCDMNASRKAAFIAVQRRYGDVEKTGQAQKLESLGVLSGGIAHDFNNILMIIMGHCSLGQAEVDIDRVQEHLKHIEAAADRAAGLCLQMLTYAGNTPMIQAQLDMRRLVDEMLTMLKSGFKKNISFDQRLMDKVPEITGDKAKVQQIVMNLVVNAVEAIGTENGVVRIGLTNAVVQAGDGNVDFIGHAIAAGSYVCLEVSDTGCGMDEKTKNRIFEPFFSTKFTGRGLGLPASSA
jgi:two-component system cell cycle sensor histidine kinase/response regulator CckA